MSVVLSAQQVTKVYPMGDIEVHALRGVDIDLVRGEFLVLLGHSGSGKSTLLNLLGGLDSPTSGRIMFGDQDLARSNSAELTQFRRENVGFVFQAYNLIPRLTALENVELITDICADPMPAIEALELVGLADRRDHFPSQLSGGEQQRVAIARAIAKKPNILLCDEPTGALDYSTGIRVLEAINLVYESLGTTTAVITHNAVIASMADRMVGLADGTIAESSVNESRIQPRELRW